MSMYEYDFYFPESFFSSSFIKISGVKGLSEGQAQQRFPRPLADISGIGFFPLEVVYISFSVLLSTIV